MTPTMRGVGALAIVAALVLHWSAPVLVDHAAPSVSGGVSDVSCPTATLCVGVGGPGVRTTTDPAAGPAGWHTTPLDAGQMLGEVSCPSASLCVAVDDHGSVLTSTDPTGGAPAWHAARIDPGDMFQNVGCSSSALCWAVGYGGIFVSESPTGGLGAWHDENFSADLPLSVSCPSASLCVGVNDDGSVFASTTPLVSSSWHMTVSNLDPTGEDQGLNGVSCATTSLCVAVDSNGNAYTTADPTGPASAWTAARIAPDAFLSSVACVPSGGCLVGGAHDGLLGSLDPAAGAASWHVVNPAFVPGECSASGVCATTDGDGSLYLAPGGPAGPWVTDSIVGADIEDVSCPTASRCIALDSDGNILTSRGLTSWQSRTVKALAGGESTLECVTASFCVATSDRLVLLSTDPTGPASSWHVSFIDHHDSQQPDTNGTGLSGVSCASIHFCVAFDSGGFVFTSTQPTGAPGRWKTAYVDRNTFDGDHQYEFEGDCPSAHLCVAADGGGNVLTSTDPAGGAHAWQAAALATDDLSSVTCQSAALCLLDGGGAVYSSTDPVNPHTFHGENVALGALSCPSARLCVSALGSRVRESTDPTGPARDWPTTVIDAADAVNDVSCPAVRRCVAVDDSGDVLVAHK